MGEVAGGLVEDDVVSLGGAVMFSDEGRQLLRLKGSLLHYYGLVWPLKNFGFSYYSILFVFDKFYLIIY